MLELEEADAKRLEDASATASAAQHDALMAEANLKGVESLFDDMLREDPEYAKLVAVKGLTDVTEFRDKYVTGTEEFKAAMLKLADEKREERGLYQTVVDAAKQAKDDSARQLIMAFEKRKKHAFRDVRDDPSRAEQVRVSYDLINTRQATQKWDTANGGLITVWALCEGGLELWFRPLSGGS
jgi:hypothetical protein